MTAKTLTTATAALKKAQAAATAASQTVTARRAAGLTTSLHEDLAFSLNWRAEVLADTAYPNRARLLRRLARKIKAQRAAAEHRDF